MAYILLAWFMALLFIIMGYAMNKDENNTRKQILYTGVGILLLVGASAMSIIDALKPH